ncbi:MAG: transporter [Paludibacteraceae bacterium]|nr:transporter [Paludibacteraceae bacterium]MBP6283884.1 transporter [Paludibacteraceae bacterium]
MNGILKIIKEWTLLLAILFGGVFHSFFGYIYSTFPFITPLLIFIMLLLTFSKLEKISIKVGSLHIKLLLIQLALSVLAYGVGRLFNNELAQGLLICVLVPTATSAAVITNLLKVDIKFITSYLLFSNVIMAFIIPIFLAYVGTQTEQGVLVSMFILAKKVLPTILLPIILLVLIKRVAPKVHVQLQRASGATFYLWSFALTLVIGKTIHIFVTQENVSYVTEITLAVGSLIVCLLQFGMGRIIGKKYGERIAAGQALGQKNTIFAIWLAQTYLSPLVSVAPAAYVFWQNTINSYQIWKARRIR